MAELKVWIAVLFCVSCTLYDVVHSYPGGPPDPGACSDMTPAHPSNSPATTPPPYRITLSTNSFDASGTITVTIDSACAIDFKGFYLQARRAEDANNFNLIGSFDTPAGSQEKCTGTGGPGTAVSHDNANAKQSMVFVWTAPAAPLPADHHVVFVATVVQDYSTYWVKFYSEVASYSSASSSVTIPPGFTFPTVDNTDCVTQPPPPTAPTQAPGSVARDSECGSSKSCFSECGSSDQCSFIISWKASADSIQFELKTGVDGSDERWVALGFSSDSTMGDDTVIECSVAGDLKEANHSRNDGKSNSRLGALSGTAIALVDNVLSCTIDVPKTNDVFDPSKAYTLLFAKGKTFASSTQKQKHDEKLISSQQADLLSTIQTISADPPSDVFVKTHGSLMITAWVFMASFGLVVARYYKKLGGSRRWCKPHIWFQLHRIAMVMTFTLASIAFIIIFVDVKGYSSVGMFPGDQQFLRAHPILGIISTALVVLNPLMALCRPHPDASSRPIFNWLHWGVGTTAWIVSIVTIFIGFEIEKSGVNPYTKYVMAAFVAYQLLIELILEIHGCMQKSETRSDDYEMKDVNGKNSEVARNSIIKSGSTGAGVFRSVILVTHFFILLGFLIALLALVNTQRLMNLYNSI